MRRKHPQGKTKKERKILAQGPAHESRLVLQNLCPEPKNEPDPALAFARLKRNAMRQPSNGRGGLGSCA